MEPIAGGDEEDESVFPEIETVAGPFHVGSHHFLNCRRGEMLLTLEELRSLNDYLAKQENGRRRWRFASQTAVPQALKQKATRASGGTATGDAKQRKVSVNKVEDALAGLATTESKIKVEWGRSLHRLLLTLMQQEVAKPFLTGLVHKSQPLASSTTNPIRRGNPEPGHMTRHSTEALRQKEISTHIQPYLEPTSLRTIISKLENGQYNTSLEVFNEIYGFFLSGYRHYQPASPHWIRIHQLATTFFASASSYPLKDEFRAPPSFVQEELPKPSTAIKQTRATPAVNKKKKRASESKTRRRAVAAAADGGEPPVRNRERRSFQKMLAALPVASHLELYEKFKTSATWKEAQEGRVELDDSQTPPAVFREMMLFCASRVTRKRPLSVHDDTTVQEADAKRRRGSIPEVPAAQKPPTAAETAAYNWTSSDSEESSSSSSSSSTSEEEEEDDTEGSVERTSAV